VRTDLTSDDETREREREAGFVGEPERSIVAPPEGVLGADESVVSRSVHTTDHSPNDGITLSFALKLRKRNNGMNHTQMAKKVATSMNVGASLSVLGCAEYRYLDARYFFASCAIPAKWKNQTKWSTTTRMQDKIKVGDVNEMNGHDLEKCCKYTKWQRIPKTRYQKGRPSKMYSRAWRTMITCEVSMSSNEHNSTHVYSSHPHRLCHA
jgi:hypothetical protein